MGRSMALLVTVIWLLSVPLSFAVDDKAQSDALKKLLGKVQEYVDTGNYPKALEELAWVKRDIEKLDFAATAKFFPDELVGFKGEAAETQSTIGITTIERVYRQGKRTIKVSLFGGSGNAGGAMGGLAALGRFAMMQQGGQKGQEMFRIDGRTARLNQKGKSADLTIHLDSGGILKFDMKRGGDVRTLREVAEAFPINDLDVYRRSRK